MPADSNSNSSSQRVDYCHQYYQYQHHTSKKNNNGLKKHQCEKWTTKYQQLLEFKAEQGHCNVPHGYKKNVGLALWVKRQRHQYNMLLGKKKSTLTGERIRLLEEIGHTWNYHDSTWEKQYEDLRQYSILHGHCDVPSSYKENLKLASWVITTRRQCKLLKDGKPGSMTLERLTKLDGIGFPGAKKCIINIMNQHNNDDSNKNGQVKFS